MAAHVGSREELSHAVFNPHDGLAARAFPTLRERREFTLTPQYAEIYRILGDRVRGSGGRPGADAMTGTPVPTSGAAGRTAAVRPAASLDVAGSDDRRPGALVPED